MGQDGGGPEASERHRRGRALRQGDGASQRPRIHPVARRAAPKNQSMAQVLVLYHTPADSAAFDRYYRDTHIPIAKKIPGLRSYLISHGPVQALAGSAPYLVAILDFD